MKKKYLFGLIAAVIICILAAFLYFFWQSHRSLEVSEMKSVVVEVTHSDGNLASFAFRTDLKFLGDLLRQQEIISGTNGSYGIASADDETADYANDKSRWRLTCNGQDLTGSIDQIVLHDGDIYGLIYTTD